MILILLDASAIGDRSRRLEGCAVLALDLYWVQVCVTVILRRFVITHSSGITLNSLFESLLNLI